MFYVIDILVFFRAMSYSVNSQATVPLIESIVLKLGGATYFI